MASNEKYNNVIIQNLSSGDILAFKRSNVKDFKVIQDLKYEETSVVGRMDPIINYVNTKKTYAISLTQNFDQSKGENLFFKEGPSVLLKKDFDAAWESYKKPDNKNFGNVLNYEMGSEQESENPLYRFFYPSYEEINASTGDSYYIRSGLYFRYMILNSKGKIWFNGYCTITNMTWNFEWPNINSTDGGLISPTRLDIAFQGTVIHEHISKISSRRIRR